MSGSMQGFTSGRDRGADMPPLGRMRARSRDRLRLLAEAIEAEIVPRLVSDYQTSAPTGFAADIAECQAAMCDGDQNNTVGPWAGTAVSPREATTTSHGHAAYHDAEALSFAPIPQAAMDLAGLVLGPDEDVVRLFVMDAVARFGLEPMCLDLLAPTARHLGDLWDQDICSFTDVTIGLMRLQSALLAVTMPLPEADGMASARRTVLLAPVPGDQHTFGLMMVAGFMERAGWSVVQLRDGSVDSLESALKANWFGVLGLSAGSTVKLKTLPRILPRLRAMSRNPDLGVMIGGPLFVANPALALELGADSTAADGPHAVQMAEALIAPRRVQRMATG